MFPFCGRVALFSCFFFFVIEVQVCFGYIPRSGLTRVTRLCVGKDSKNPSIVSDVGRSAVSSRGSIGIEDTAIPEPGYGEVVVKITASGLCGTDIHCIDQDWSEKPSSSTPGHEGVGRIIAIGEGVVNDELKIGTRVGLPWLAKTCGDCSACVTGNENFCSNSQYCGFTIPGCLADYVLYPSSHVVLIPSEISDVQAAPLLCAGVTTYKALKVANLIAGDFVVILGAGGGLGHLAIQYATSMGYRVVAIDKGVDKCDFAIELGAEVAFDCDNDKLIECVKEYTGGKGAHACINCAPSISAIELSPYLLRTRGTIVQVALPPGNFGIDIELLVMKGLTVKGSLVGTREDMREALALAARNKVRASVRVESLDEVSSVVDKLRKGEYNARVVFSEQNGAF